MAKRDGDMANLDGDLDNVDGDVTSRDCDLASNGGIANGMVKLPTGMICGQQGR